MTQRPSISAFALSVGLLWAFTPSLSAETLKFSGSLAGIVADPGGVRQMGASVALYNRFDRLIHRALTDEKGAFDFPGLPSDFYSVRVTAASFMPAVRQNISIQPGMRSFLAINLAGVVSSVQLVYTAPEGAMMNDNWMWTLRSAWATRPVLRALPGIVEPTETVHQVALFSDTRGLVRLSAGDTGPLASAGNQMDLGTAFAVATSFLGSNQLQFSGNLGYASRAGLPSAAFRTSFVHTEQGVSGPEVSVTVRQTMLPGRSGTMGGQPDNMPFLRSMSLGMVDRVNLTDNLRMEYGASADLVTFFEQIKYISPFARLTYNLGSYGTVQAAYSSGAPPLELLVPHEEAEGADGRRGLQSDLATLNLFPRVSLRGGRAKVQQTENIELGYQKQLGGTTLSVGVHDETNTNSALTIAGAEGFSAVDDLLPDLSSNSSIFNIGNYHSFGYTASVRQALGERFSIGLAFGNGGSLRTEDRELDANSAADLRSRIHQARRNWATGQVAGSVPYLGTQFVGSYQWTDYRSLTPSHIYLTQPVQSEAGLNVRLRQPIPSLGILPGRLEATVEMRNMLAQGYLPVTSASGRRMLLIHSPRAMRGGISFIF